MMTDKSEAKSTTIVIFGASGDLTSRKLIPALYNLYRKERLPEEFNIVGVSRTPYSHDDFRKEVEAGVREFSKETFTERFWRAICKHIWYIPGDASKPGELAKINEALLELEKGSCNRLYYLSVSPTLYPTIVKCLGTSGMAKEDGGWRRIIIEKPFGTDLASAKELNRLVHEVFDESQVYRIDHYLGKETAQNILFFRFTNTIFETVWNRNYVEYVQINVLEEVDVGHRAAYYDKAGVLRDMFQNHLLQLLSLVAMEPPISFNATELRNEKVKVIRAIRRIPLSDTVRAQYEAYRQADGVPQNSTTPTYAALKLYIDNWRWQGVPFYMRSGKALGAKTSQIRIRFRKPPQLMFNLSKPDGFAPNVLTICIQPDEGISLSIEAKLPDSHETRSVNMDFDYKTSFGENPIPEAYERLLLDTLNGDASLFTRSDEIEALWDVVDPILQGWDTGETPPVETYPTGSMGPKGAEELVGRDGHEWHLGCNK
jgi:glucose-6-phosphate 1-dehydrogenase